MSETKLQRQKAYLRKVFNDDQLVAMSRRSTKGMSWSLPTVKKALQLRFSCGTTGYNDLIEMGTPLVTYF